MTFVLRIKKKEDSTGMPFGWLWVQDFPLV